MVFLLQKFNKFESNWRNYLNDYLKLDMNSFNWCQPAVKRPATDSRNGKTWNLGPVLGLEKQERSTLCQAESWRYLKNRSLAGFQTLAVSKREKLDLPDQFPLTSFPLFFVSFQDNLSERDQYQYLGNCPPTPPLTQRQSIDNKLGLMLG